LDGFSEKRPRLSWELDNCKPCLGPGTCAGPGTVPSRRGPPSRLTACCTPPVAPPLATRPPVAPPLATPPHLVSAPTGHTNTRHEPTGHPATCRASTGHPATRHAPSCRPATCHATCHGVRFAHHAHGARPLTRASTRSSLFLRPTSPATYRSRAQVPSGDKSNVPGTQRIYMKHNHIIAPMSPTTGARAN
jgi:hypothetical protein